MRTYESQMYCNTSLLNPYESYEENVVLWERPQIRNMLRTVEAVFALNLHWLVGSLMPTSKTFMGGGGRI